MICAAFLTAISLHAASGYNTFTPGGGVSCNDNQIVGSAMVFKNSIGRVSVATAIGYQFDINEHIKIEPFIGLSTGYYKPIVPIAGIAVKYDKFQIIVLPPTNKNPVTLNFSLYF